MAMTVAEFRAALQAGRKLVLWRGLVVDVAAFMGTVSGLQQWCTDWCYAFVCRVSRRVSLTRWYAACTLPCSTLAARSCSIVT